MSLKKVIVTAASIGAAVIAVPTASAAIIGFTGSFAAGNWTTTLTGGPPAGGGAPAGVNTSGAPASVQLTGGDSGCGSYFLSGTPGPCATNFTIVMPAGFSSVSFHWEYTTNDNGADFDPFGVLVNGVFTELTNPIFGNQSGNFGMAGLAGATFGFSINCTDCNLGELTVTISQFQAPEPGSLALLGMGLAGFAGLRRRRPA